MIFFLGLLVNILSPVIYAIYSYRVNDAINESFEALNEVWEANRRQLYIAFYSVGVCQAISVIFMLWAVFRLYFAIGRNFNLRELFS